MVGLLTITERDLRLLVDIVTVSRSDARGDMAAGLPPSMLDDLLVAVGCDCVTFAGLDSARSVTWSVQGQPTAGFLGSQEGFWRNFWECESCSYPDRPGTGARSRPYPISILLGNGTIPDIIQSASRRPA